MNINLKKDASQKLDETNSTTFVKGCDMIIEFYKLQDSAIIRYVHIH